MSNISISQLNTNGSALLTDSESFLSDLSDAQLTVKGGGKSSKRGGCGYGSSRGKSRKSNKSGRGGYCGGGYGYGYGGCH